MKLIIATTNMNKVREFKEMLKSTQIEVISMKEAGVEAVIEETGETFEENAVQKACAVRDLTGQTVIADDSGLEIDYLGGAPGIHSARFMGHETSYDLKCAAILDKMKDVPDEKRTARFVCAMAIARPLTDEPSNVKVFRGVMEGKIAREPAGENGFGYDPIFYLPEYGLTSAELTPEEKNSISHRGKALRQTIDYIDADSAFR